MKFIEEQSGVEFTLTMKKWKLLINVTLVCRMHDVGKQYQLRRWVLYAQKSKKHSRGKQKKSERFGFSRRNKEI